MFRPQVCLCGFVKIAIFNVRPENELNLPAVGQHPVSAFGSVAKKDHASGILSIYHLDSYAERYMFSLAGRDMV
jgi:hypothetical protein